MGILQTIYRKHVAFDPNNPEHRLAYWILRTTGRQDEHLRFIVEEGYTSVLTMMQTKIADHFSQPAPASVASVSRRKAAKEQP
jgi:hypothetical protein